MNKHYMHVNTGSVDTYENWLSDCQAQDIPQNIDNLIANGSLVEVINVNNEWHEV